VQSARFRCAARIREPIRACIRVAIAKVNRARRGSEEKARTVPDESRKDISARLRATIEEELGAFRRFADVPAAELEEMAARLVRAIAPLVAADTTEHASRAA
jgi:hypothetical protein